jgi:hypothetical protein
MDSRVIAQWVYPSLDIFIQLHTPPSTNGFCNVRGLSMEHDKIGASLRMRAITYASLRNHEVCENILLILICWEMYLNLGPSVDTLAVVPDHPCDAKHVCV